MTRVIATHFSDQDDITIEASEHDYTAVLDGHRIYRETSIKGLMRYLRQFVFSDPSVESNLWSQINRHTGLPA